jgi:hypothetical protein
MVRGTAAQFRCRLPYAKHDIALIEAKFWQVDSFYGLNAEHPLPIIEGYKKTISADGEIVTQYPWSWVDDYTICVRLSQQQTLTFTDKFKAKCQFRGKTIDGTPFASYQEYIPVYPIHGDDPLGDHTRPSHGGDEWIVLDGETII